MDAFTFLSGNIRGWSSAERDGEHAWPTRAPLYAALLRDLSPHLVGLQEFAGADLPDLAPALPFHASSLGCEGEPDRYVPIFWDTRRFRKVDAGGFWLNRWTDRRVPGWDAENERSTTWVELADRSTGRRLLVVNTHLDHVGEVARVRGAQLILDFLDDWPPGTPIVVTGDFNSGPYRPFPRTPYTPRAFGLFAEAGFMDAYRSATGEWPPPATFHAFRGDAYTPDRHGTWYTDWPLTRNLRVVSARILRHEPGAKPLSDHYPVHVEAAFTGPA